jgi:8-oxo-dGTP diphosphatase
MRALDAEGFVAYAQAQIAAAERIQAGHRPTGGFCRCGRLWPCSVVQTCVRTRDHYRARLALLDQTVHLPTIPNPPPEPVRIPRCVKPGTECSYQRPPSTPGGHIDPNEVPAQAAQREVLEETGLHTQTITDPLFTHPAVTTHAPPYAIIEMDVADTKVGPHRHIDLVYVLRVAAGSLSAQLDEVGAARWVPLADLGTLDTPAELPALVTDTARWAKARWLVDPPNGEPADQMG